MNITLLGTGLMGFPMARRLCEAGNTVRVWNRDRSKAEGLAAHGATVCNTPGEAVQGSEFVITMLQDGLVVESVLFDQGAAAAMLPGTVVIDMSSIQPAQARAHADRLGHMGITHIDAPVSGGTLGAEAGTLAWPSWSVAKRPPLSAPNLFFPHWAAPPWWAPAVQASWPSWPTR